MITVMNLVYLMMTNSLVEWENHKFQSQADNSLILKNFFFQFFNSYIYLGYLVVFQQQTIDQLELTIIVHIATSMGSFLGINFIVPYVLFQWNLSQISNKWAQFYSKFYEPYFRQKADMDKVKTQKVANRNEVRNTENKPKADDNKVYLLPEVYKKEDTTENSAMDYTHQDSDLHKQIEFTVGMKPFIPPKDVFMFLVF